MSRAGVVVFLLLVSVRACLSARANPRDLGAWQAEAVIKLADSGLGFGDEPSHEEQQMLRFLMEYMPAADRKMIHYEDLHRMVHLALQARAQNGWASDVPFDVFLNYVLPYANLDEPREDWRSSFYEKFSPLVAGTDNILDAAVALNYQIWTLGNWNITFVAGQTPEIMSPSQVIAHGYASCTGLAIFFVDACRAVGIPARVVGIAEWPATGGNHNWVEVWHEGAWSFTDPLGYPNRPWNTTWFFPDPVSKALPHSYAHGVWSASYKHTGHPFPLAWHDEYESTVPGQEVTRYYLDAAAAAAGEEPSGAGGSDPSHARKHEGEDGGDDPGLGADRAGVAARSGDLSEKVDVLVTPK